MCGLDLRGQVLDPQVETRHGDGSVEVPQWHNASLCFGMRRIPAVRCRVEVGTISETYKMSIRMMNVGLQSITLLDKLSGLGF